MRKIQHLNAETLNTKIYNVLKDMIIKNEFEPGSRMVINQLCEAFGVSSTPVRDALHYLEADGLIESKDNGTYVINLTKEDVEEIYEMREVLEVFAVEKVFFNLKKVILKDLKEKMLNSNVDDNFINDMEFHNFIINGCKNKRLKNQLRILCNQSFHLGYKLHQQNTIHEEIKEHINIISAMIEGNLEAAKKFTKIHLIKTKERILKNCF